MKTEKKLLMGICISLFFVLLLLLIVAQGKSKKGILSPALIPTGPQALISIKPIPSENPEIFSIKEQLIKLKVKTQKLEEEKSSLLPPEISFGLGIKP